MEYTVLFEDGSRIDLEPGQIGRLCRDTHSWFRVLRMITGYADYAMLKISAIDPSNNEEVVVRAAVFLEAPPYDWKFPPEETA